MKLYSISMKINLFKHDQLSLTFHSVIIASQWARSD